MISAGVAVFVGFWKWKEEEDHTLDDWQKWFYGIEGTAGKGYISVGGIVFANEKRAELINATIEGYGIGVGVEVGFGVAWSSAYYKRIHPKYAPLWLQHILAPM